MWELVSNALLGGNMDQILDQALYWLSIPCAVLHYVWATLVFGIGGVLSWLHEALRDVWTTVAFGAAAVHAWLRIPYDALWALPYFWLRAIFGVATGLLIRRTLVGLSACVLGNAALYVCAGWSLDPGLPPNLVVLLIWSIFAFWFVGRILRRGILVFGFHFAAGVAAIAIGLWLLVIALPHIPIAWFLVRLAWIGLAVVGGAAAIVGLHLLWEDRLSLLLDDWRFRRNSR